MGCIPTPLRGIVLSGALLKSRRLSCPAVSRRVSLSHRVFLIVFLLLVLFVVLLCVRWRLLFVRLPRTVCFRTRRWLILPSLIRPRLRLVGSVAWLGGWCPVVLSWCLRIGTLISRGLVCRTIVRRRPILIRSIHLRPILFGTIRLCPLGLRGCRTISRWIGLRPLVSSRLFSWAIILRRPVIGSICSRFVAGAVHGARTFVRGWIIRTWIAGSLPRFVSPGLFALGLFIPGLFTPELFLRDCSADFQAHSPGLWRAWLRQWQAGLQAPA